MRALKKQASQFSGQAGPEGPLIVVRGHIVLVNLADQGRSSDRSIDRPIGREKSCLGVLTILSRAVDPISVLERPTQLNGDELVRRIAPVLFYPLVSVFSGLFKSYDRASGYDLYRPSTITTIR
jgi:hypothetical protein